MMPPLLKGLMAQLGYDITISDAADNINVYHQSDACQQIITWLLDLFLVLLFRCFIKKKVCFASPLFV